MHSVMSVTKIVWRKVEKARLQNHIDSRTAVKTIRLSMAQYVPEREWLGSLVPKLSEKAKAIYLEIPDNKAQDFKASKNIILEAYQHTVDYYRFKFRNSEKGPEEDFVQWNNRSRRYLDRWMRVARAKGDEESVLERVLIEKMLDSVSPELRSWMIEKKAKTSEELAKLANEHVQAIKGPWIDGKYMGHVKTSSASEDNSTDDEQADIRGNSVTIPANTERNAQTRRAQGKDGVRCYFCGEKGHLSYDCKEKNKTQQ